MRPFRLISVGTVIAFVILVLVLSALPAAGQGPDDPLGVHARETANAAQMNAQNAMMAATAAANATRQSLSVQATANAISYQQTIAVQNAQASATAISAQQTVVAQQAAQQQQLAAQNAQATANAQSAAATRAILESSNNATRAAVEAERAVQAIYATATRQSQMASASATAQAQSASASVTAQFLTSQGTATSQAQSAIATRQVADATATAVAIAIQDLQEKENRNRFIANARDVVWQIVPSLFGLIILCLLAYGTFLQIHGAGLRANTLRDASGAPTAMMPSIPGSFTVITPGLASAPIMHVRMPSLWSRLREWLLERQEAAVTEHAYNPDVTRRHQAIGFAAALAQGSGAGRAQDPGIFEDEMSEAPRVKLLTDPTEVVDGQVLSVLDEDWAAQ